MEFMMTVDIHRPTRGLSPDGGIGSTLLTFLKSTASPISAGNHSWFSKEFCDVSHCSERGRA